MLNNQHKMGALITLPANAFSSFKTILYKPDVTCNDNNNNSRNKSGSLNNNPLNVLREDSQETFICLEEEGLVQVERAAPVQVGQVQVEPPLVLQQVEWQTVFEGLNKPFPEGQQLPKKRPRAKSLDLMQNDSKKQKLNSNEQNRKSLKRSQPSKNRWKPMPKEKSTRPDTLKKTRLDSSNNRKPRSKRPLQHKGQKYLRKRRLDSVR